MRNTLQDLEIIKAVIALLPQHSKSFEVKTETSFEEVNTFGLKLEEIIKNKGFENEFDINWSCEEIKLIRSVLATILMDLDDFEFHTVLGYSDEEVWQVLKKVRVNLDNICYPRTSQ